MNYLGNVGASDSVIRSMTAAQWTAGNYALSVGQLGIESDTGLQKAGTGSKWSDTPYIPAGNGVNDVIVFSDLGAAEHSVTIVNGIITSWITT